MHKVLALTTDGRMTYCTCEPEERGKGRCNHIAHQEEGEKTQDFINRVSSLKGNIYHIVPYKMDDDEMLKLQEITGRKDLADKDCDGGYIPLPDYIWSPADIKYFSQLSGFKESNIIDLICCRSVYDIDKERFIDVKNKKDDGNYLEGVDGMNRLAKEKFDYEATNNIYVIPYYMRTNINKGTPNETINPINKLYNALCVSRVKSTQKMQECYFKLLDNKNVYKDYGIKPDDVGNHGYALPGLKEFFEGKKGVLRKYLEGFSIGYTGRSVIIPNIHRPCDECGIPANMAVTTFKPTIEKELISQGLTPKERDAFYNKFLVDDQASIKGEDLVRLNNILIKVDAKGILNRQPSLHTGSQICFKARVSGTSYDKETKRTVAIGIGPNNREDFIINKGREKIRIDTNLNNSGINGIELNPMLCSNFNSDFDGDTMAFYGINTDDSDGELASKNAYDEMSLYSPLVSHNSASQNDQMFAPTKDCLFGLLNIFDD